MSTYYPCRPEHILARNHGNKTPANVVYLAAESQLETYHESEGREERTLAAWAAIHCRLHLGVTGRRDEWAGTAATEFWPLLYGAARNRQGLVVIGPRLAQSFALLNGWDEMESGQLVLSGPSQFAGPAADGGARKVTHRLGTLVLDGPGLILECWHGGSRIVWLDLGNYYSDDLVSLADWLDTHTPGSAIGEHGTGSHDASSLQGARIAELAMEKWWWLVRRHQLGQWAWTAAGQAWRAWRHSHMDVAVRIHGNAEVLTLERQAYRGARQDVWAIGPVQGPLYQLDVRSLFAAVMRGRMYPYDLVGLEVAPSVTHVRDTCAKMGAIASVRLKTAAHQYPYFTSQRVLYPVGEYTATLAGPELRRALDHDEVVGVGLIAWYSQADLFTTFVDQLWKLRSEALKEDDLIAAGLYKRLLVSLYGKFAQRGYSRTPYPGWIDGPAWGRSYHLTPDGGTPIALTSIAGVRYREVVNQEGPDSFPAIAAYVTSYARIYMDSLRAVAGAEHVYHQYIDSLIVDQVGMDRLAHALLVNDYRLGALRVKGRVDSAEFFGPGLYRWGSELRCCGLQPGARKVGPYRYEVVEEEGPRGMVARPPDGTIRYRRILKQIVPAALPHVRGEDGRLFPPVVKE